MNKFISLIFVSVLLVSCGGGGGSSNGGSDNAPEATNLNYVEVNEQIFNGDREVLGVLSDGTETLTIIKNPSIDLISELYYNSGSGTETALIYTINSDGLPSKVSAHDGTYIEFNYPAIDTSPTTLKFYNADNNLVYETTATIDINIVKQAYSDLTNMQSSSISLSSVKTITSKNLAQAQTTTTCVTKDREYQCESAEPIEISPQTSRYIDYGITAISAVITAVTIKETKGIALTLGITNLLYLKTRLLVAGLGIDINDIPALRTTDNILSHTSCAVSILSLSGCITQGLQVLKNTIFVIPEIPPTTSNGRYQFSTQVNNFDIVDICTPRFDTLDKRFTVSGSTCSSNIEGEFSCNINSNTVTLAEDFNFSYTFNGEVEVDGTPFVGTIDIEIITNFMVNLNSLTGSFSQIFSFDSSIISNHEQIIDYLRCSGTTSATRL